MCSVNVKCMQNKLYIYKHIFKEETEEKGNQASGCSVGCGLQ